MPTQEIAQACRFSSPALLSRTFKDHFGPGLRAFSSLGNLVVSAHTLLSQDADPGADAHALNDALLPLFCSDHCIIHGFLGRARVGQDIKKEDPARR